MGTLAQDLSTRTLHRLSNTTSLWLLSACRLLPKHRSLTHQQIAPYPKIPTIHTVCINLLLYFSSDDHPSTSRTLRLNQQAINRLFTAKPFNHWRHPCRCTKAQSYKQPLCSEYLYPKSILSNVSVAVLMLHIRCHICDIIFINVSEEVLLKQVASDVNYAFL